jgi:putative ABC transport system substrate-binding protein
MSKKTIVLAVSALLFALTSVGALLLALCFPAEAQQPKKVPRIGFLSPRSSGPDFRTDAFRHGLRELGYVEEKNIHVEYRYAEGSAERLPELAVELVRLKVDIIVTSCVPGVRAAKNASKNIPIVIASAADPVASGLVASLARPGENVTGLSLLAPEIGGKRLEIIKETLPKVGRVGILLNTANPYHRKLFNELEATARSLALQAHALEVRNANDFEGAFSTAIKERSGAVAMLEDPLLFINREAIVELAGKNRLPAMYPEQDFVQAGGFMSYGANAADLYRRAAIYVDKILKGAKPAELPVEQPTKFEFVINLKTAKQIGVTIPPSVLARADRVIR